MNLDETVESCCKKVVVPTIIINNKVYLKKLIHAEELKFIGKVEEYLEIM